MSILKKIVIYLSLVVLRLNNFYVRNVDFLPIFQEKKNIYIIYNIYIKNRDTNFVISDINNLIYENSL